MKHLLIGGEKLPGACELSAYRPREAKPGQISCEGVSLPYYVRILCPPHAAMPPKLNGGEAARFLWQLSERHSLSVQIRTLSFDPEPGNLEAPHRPLARAVVTVSQLLPATVTGPTVAKVLSFLTRIFRRGEAWLFGSAAVVERNVTE